MKRLRCLAEVAVAPSIVHELDEQDVREDQNARFECTYRGLPEPDVTWYDTHTQLITVLIFYILIQIE